MRIRFSRSRALLLSLSLCCLSSASNAIAQDTGAGVRPAPPPFAAGGTLSAPILFAPDNTIDIGASGATRPRSIYLSGHLFLPASSGAFVRWENQTKLSSPSDGVLTLFNNAGSDFSRLQFGGTTNSFPAFSRSGTTILVRLADDSAAGSLQGNLIVGNGNNLYSAANGGGNRVVMAATAPTISSGFGTSPTIAFHNGTGAFGVNVGTGGTATSGVIGLPTATTGWICFVEDSTANAGAAAGRADRRTIQTGTTTTTATVTHITISTGVALAWAASDVLTLHCFGY